MTIEFIKCNNLSLLPGIKHGFFTRLGGHSDGVYSSMNCGPGSLDDPEMIRLNRIAAMRELDLGDENKLHTLNQVHSNRVVIINNIQRGRHDADAIVTNTPEIALGILTADCVPILFADADSGVAGAAHAGWRGAMYGIIENTIAAMVQLGAKRNNIQVAIGPAIAQVSYEVGAEFYDRFIAEKRENCTFFIPSCKPGHFMFNLPLYVSGRLRNAGIQAECIEDSMQDTCSVPDRFFSYRYNCLAGLKDYGRNLSVIAMV